MICETTQDWIWECEHPDDEPPDDVAEHLETCTACQAELRGRRSVARDLRALRFALDEAPPQATDRAVLMGVGEALVNESEAFAPPANITTEVHHHHGGSRGPQATPGWMLAAAAILFMAIGLGFAAGRVSSPQIAGPTASGETHTALATLGGQDPHRTHAVGLRQSSLDTLMSGSTYLLAGPRGGPYRVVGRVNVQQLEESPLPMAGNEEIVVAMAPGGEWTQDSRLALNDLSDPNVSILARRSLANR